MSPFKSTVIFVAACAFASCSPHQPQRVDTPNPPATQGKADGFDWGSGCEDGSGTFTQEIAKDAAVNVGTIPKDKADLLIKLTSDKDVDIQLFDEDGTAVVAWPDGKLNDEGEKSLAYKGVTITYSGYNGDGTNYGHEFIKIEGVTENAFVMKAFGYAAGHAQVDYSFKAKPGCTQGSGSGTFEQEIGHHKVVDVGTIPSGIANVKISLKSPVDIDIQLYHGEVKVVHWSQGLLKGATKVTKTYNGVSITWSGYNGDGTGQGNEYIEFEGTTANSFEMKVFGYEAGQATVDYSWGDNGGDGDDEYKPFDQRVKAFEQKYSTAVTLATKQQKPAIFLDTKTFADDQAKVKAFYADLYKMMGTNTVMIWNPAGENYFHLATPQSPLLDETFRNRAMRLYSVIHIWDISLGNLEDACYSDDGYDEEDYVDLVEDSCLEEYQVKAVRAAALIKLTNDQMKELNKYLSAIVDDFEATLGPAEYNGGTPPYFGGSEHNCTSWFSTFLQEKVSTQFWYHANPASLLSSITKGSSNGNTADAFRGMVVFNHDNPPQEGATIERNFPFDFGH